jgi:hypothetical protein
MGVNAQRHAPAALKPRGKDPRHPFYRRLGGLQSCSGQKSQRKNFLPLPRFEPRSSGRPVHSQTLYLVSYPGSLLLLYMNTIMRMRRQFVCPDFNNFTSVFYGSHIPCVWQWVNDRFCLTATGLTPAQKVPLETEANYLLLSWQNRFTARYIIVACLSSVLVRRIISLFEKCGGAKSSSGDRSTYFVCFATR